MASGFFMGGLAQGINNASDTLSTAMNRNALIQLQGARLMQEKKQHQRAEFMSLRSDAVTHLDDVMTQLRIAHPTWTDAQLMANPAVVSLRDSIGSLDKNLGLPNTIDSIVAGIAAKPSAAATEAALARAKEGPMHQQLVQSEINKNRAVSGQDPIQFGAPANPKNPDLDTSTQLGGGARMPGANGTVGNPKPVGQQSDTFNQRFAQAATVDAPKVLSWPEARSKVAEKYGPEVTTKAELWLKGNPGVVTGLRGSGRNNERKQIQDAAMDLANAVGLDPDQINQRFIDFAGKKAAATAKGRAAGGREANLGIILTVADSAVDAAIAASANVPRGDFVPLNEAKQWASAKFSSEPLKIFQQKNLQLAELWAKSMNPTGVMRNEDRELALGVLNTAIGNGTYAAAAHAVRASIGLEKASAIKYLKDQGYGPPDTESPSGSDTGSDFAPTGIPGVSIRQKSQ